MFRGRTPLVATLVACAAATGAETVVAHGPCRCLSPASGPPGTTVNTNAAGYKVVFNPNQTDLPIGPQSLWREHRPGLPSTVVFQKAYRYADLPLRDPVAFEVPQAPPGRYLVSIYDGSEGGSHYTWEYFRVTERRVGPPATRASATSPPATAEAPGPSLLASVIVGVAALLVGLVLGAGGARRCHRFARIQ